MSGAGIDNKLIQRFRSLRIWTNADQRAPNKPLLALWAIGQCLDNSQRLKPYSRVEKEVGELLTRFGPYRVKPRVEYPFWRLQKDKVWEIDRPHLVKTTSRGDPSVDDLKEHSIRGGFTTEVFFALQENHLLAWSIADSLLTAHFPATLHEKILEATSIQLDIQTAPDSDDESEFLIVRRRPRDWRFRSKIMKAYAYRCAVCEFDVRMDEDPLAIEAAHIRWHEAKGPPVVNNGLALCSLHHKLFDAGAFTLQNDLEVVIAPGIEGSSVEDALYRYSEQPLRSLPKNSQDLPSPHYLDWHQREVFKGPFSVANSIGDYV